MNECYYDKRMDFFYNRSNTDTADEWTGTKLLIVLCFGTFFCLFIFFSNSLVIAAVIKNRKFHFPFYYLLANLAAADFFCLEHPSPHTHTIHSLTTFLSWLQGHLLGEAVPHNIFFKSRTVPV